MGPQEAALKGVIWDHRKVISRLCKDTEGCMGTLDCKVCRISGYPGVGKVEHIYDWSNYIWFLR